MALLTVLSSKCVGMPEMTSKRLWAVGPTSAWHASATASLVTPSPWGSFLVKCLRIISRVSALWNHNISSGLLPPMLRMAASVSVALDEERLPEDDVFSRFILTFFLFDSKLGLCGVCPGEDEDEEEESLRFGALVEDITLAVTLILMGKVTSATARQISIRAWKYVENLPWSATPTPEPPQALPDTQFCVSSSYNLWSSDCRAISIARQGLSCRAIEDDNPAGFFFCSRLWILRSSSAKRWKINSFTHAAMSVVQRKLPVCGRQDTAVSNISVSCFIARVAPVTLKKAQEEVVSPAVCQQ